MRTFKSFDFLRELLPFEKLHTIQHSTQCFIRNSDTSTPQSQFKPGFHMIATIAAIAEKKKGSAIAAIVAIICKQGFKRLVRKLDETLRVVFDFFLREKAFRVELNCFTALRFLVTWLLQNVCVTCSLRSLICHVSSSLC